MELPLTGTINQAETSIPVPGRNYLYRTLRSLFRISTRVYFSRIIVDNLKAVPKDVPLILVSNHPSAFMDPILLGSLLPQECIFLARGEAFKKKIGSIMMHKFNALPVYREDVSPDKVHLNRDTFRKSFQLLDHGKTLFFFPEGLSQTEPRLRPMKKGLARLVFNYAEETNWQHDVCLLPVGLSYTDPHSFRSKVAVHFGEPIHISALKNTFSENKASAINKLTDWFRQQLEGLTLFIPDEKDETFARQAEQILGFWETENTKPVLDGLHTITENMHVLQKENPAEAEKIKAETQVYFNQLNAIGVQDKDVKANEQRNIFTDLLLFIFGSIVGLPLFIYGALNHIFPYLLGVYVTKKMSPRPDFTGSLRLASGSFGTVIFYILQTLVVGLLSGSFAIIFLYVISLPLSGYFSIHYVEWIQKMRRTMKLHSLKSRSKQKLSELINLRNKLQEMILLLGTR